jgi:hypothetical protein
MVRSLPDTGPSLNCNGAGGYTLENSAIARRGAASRSWAMESGLLRVNVTLGRFRHHSVTSTEFPEPLALYVHHHLPSSEKLPRYTKTHKV